jgi:hypothetical protein
MCERSFSVAVCVSHDTTKLMHITVCISLDLWMSVSGTGKLLLAISSTAIPGSGSRGAHDHNFSRLTTLGVVQLLFQTCGNRGC